MNCPICNKLLKDDNKNQYKPFCSNRCKLIDLGDWFSENNTIAENEISLSVLDNDKD